MTVSVPEFVDAGWVSEVELGDGLAVLFYEDGPPRFRHRCDRTATDRGVIICAPLLADAHKITCRSPLTITPSVLCSDCGTHGWVRDGVWVPA